MEVVNIAKLIKFSDFNHFKKMQLQIFWNVPRKSLYRVLLSMKLLYQKVSLCVDNVPLRRFNIDFIKYNA